MWREMWYMGKDNEQKKNWGDIGEKLKMLKLLRKNSNLRG